MNCKTMLPVLVAFFSAAAITGCSSAADNAQSSHEDLSAAQCATATAWAPWVAYSTGTLVTYAGGTYDCVQGHTSEPGWTPTAVPALWTPVTCAGGGATSGGGTSTGGGSTTGGGTTTTGSGSSSCDANAWVYMGSNANACDGLVGESCGWTSSNEGQGYHCATTSWGTGCEPGGTTCPGGGSTGSGSTGSGSTGSGSTGSGSTGSGSTGSGSTGSGSTGSGSTGTTGKAPAGLIFSAYKDTSINMNWNTNVISTNVNGSTATLASDASSAGAKTVTLAFATGECGSENWGGVQGAAMASANVSLLSGAGVNYIISTGGAAGTFTCGSDSGFDTFIGRWASSNLIGVDFDIEAGQTPSVISDLIARIKTAHGTYPNLRFSLTLATLANNNGASSAQSLGSSAPDSFNVYGDEVLAAVQSTLGFSGASSWPSYVTVDLMTMDYGSASAGVCVVSGGACDMGQSALQAAYNLHDHWGVPFANIELTPMIGQNDASSEQFTLQNADTVAQFAISQGLGGVHYWSYDRDTDSAPGSASPTGNSMGSGYAGAHGFLKRFLGDGL
jgi:chitinase